MLTWNLPWPKFHSLTERPYRYVQFWEKRNHRSARIGENVNAQVDGFSRNLEDTNTSETLDRHVGAGSNLPGLLLQVPDYSRLDPSVLFSPGKYKEAMSGNFELESSSTMTAEADNFALSSVSPLEVGNPESYSVSGPTLSSSSFDMLPNHEYIYSSSNASMPVRGVPFVSPYDTSMVNNDISINITPDSHAGISPYGTQSRHVSDMVVQNPSSLPIESNDLNDCSTLFTAGHPGLGSMQPSPTDYALLTDNIMTNPASLAMDSHMHNYHSLGDWALDEEFHEPYAERPRYGW